MGKQLVGKVVHCKKEPFEVYIGRPSKWGNHFSHLPASCAEVLVSSREEAIEKYKQWLIARPELIEEAKKELKGKTLGCWCKPKACHGDVLVEVANS